MGSLDGRVAIITGASRGIGQHVAERFAAEGAAVALVARTLTPGTSRLPGSISEVVARIQAHGGQAVAIQADLTAPEDVETVVTQAETALGPVGCAPYGMCKIALDRLTTGLAAELEGTGVSINSLGTAGLVMTPGVAVVSPHTPDNAPVEPDSAMADAALLLCSAPKGTVTGRITYSMDLLGQPFPDGPWALSATF